MLAWNGVKGVDYWSASGKVLVTDFVDEVQVKSSGYTAEYGGATGGDALIAFRDRLLGAQKQDIEREVGDFVTYDILDESIIVVPSASVAAIMMFSVPVTVWPSKVKAAPRSRPFGAVAVT